MHMSHLKFSEKMTTKLECPQALLLERVCDQLHSKGLLALFCWHIVLS